MHVCVCVPYLYAIVYAHVSHSTQTDGFLVWLVPVVIVISAIRIM